MNENDLKKLLDSAREVSKKSYSPYSNFPVGACVLFESGKSYLGCNIENVSYGLTLCAERAAISRAISDGEKTKIKAIAIYSPKQKQCLPCGACRQWINEFAKDEKTIIVLEDENEKPCVLTLQDVFPHGFKFN